MRYEKYDGQELAIMIDELEADGTAMLASEALSDFDASVELVMEEDVVSGTATSAGEEPTSFTAAAATATGVCGVYGAQGNPVLPTSSWRIYG